MKTSIVKDETVSVRSEYMEKIEKLAIELFNVTGVKMTNIELSWKFNQENNMIELEEDEYLIGVEVTGSSFI